MDHTPLSVISLVLVDVLGCASVIDSIHKVC